MAYQTDPKLQNAVVYSLYVRNHSPEGTFRAVIPDLDRIRALGTDILWLLPIHPIGVQGKKGSLGCPYANQDYRTVNPAYGTMEDFRALVDAIHARGMKCMIDVVYNHTSPDSTLYREHPDFFYHNAQGRPGNKVGDWADVIDLDYGNTELWDYQIQSLYQWARLVDGFRCDVASLVPVDFWKWARQAVKAVRPDCIWLAETVHLSFGNQVRRSGFRCDRDPELFEIFDIEYQYDIWEDFTRYLRGEAPLSRFLEMLNVQEALYPVNYNKLRFLENHDQPRIASRVRSEKALVSFTAMLYFLKGTTLLYAGQEFADTHLPSLYDKEPIDRQTGRDLSPLLARLNQIKKQALAPDDFFFARADDENAIAILERVNRDGRKLGLFPLEARGAAVSLDVPDGVYRNLMDDSQIPVRGGQLLCPDTPVIFTLPR